MAITISPSSGTFSSGGETKTATVTQEAAPKYPTSFSWDGGDVTIAVTDTLQLTRTGTVTYSDGTTAGVNVTNWGTQDEDIARISNTGLLTAGQSIDLTQGSAGYTEGGVTVWSTFSIEVTREQTSISISPASSSIEAEGGDITLTVTYTGFSTATYIRQPEIPDGWGINTYSTRTYTNSVVRIYTVTVPSSTITRDTDYALVFSDNFGATGTASITQKAYVAAHIEPSSDTKTVNYQAQSFTVYKDYYNQSYSDINAPTTSYSWITITETSHTTYSDRVRVNYRVTVTETLYGRNGIVVFTGANSSRAILTVIQEDKRDIVFTGTNPVNVPATTLGLNYSGQVDYYGVLWPDEEIKPIEINGDWLRISSGSRRTDGRMHYSQSYTVHPANNLGTEARDGSIVFELDGLTPYTWSFHQAGDRKIDADEDTINFTWQQGSDTLSVRYYNIAASDIYNPSSDSSWCTVTKSSGPYEYSGYTLVNYRVSVTENSGSNRGATLTFSARNALNEYVTVAQDEKIWVEFDSTVENPLDLGWRGETNISCSVWYRNVPSSSAAIQAPSISANWIRLERSSSYYSANLGTRITYYFTVSDNYSHNPRGGTVTYRVTGGSPGSVSWQIARDGCRDVAADPIKLDWDYKNHSANVGVTYYNVPYSEVYDPVKPNWVTISERSHIASSSGSYVQYRVSVNENTSWPRSGNITWYGYDSLYAYTQVKQGAKVYPRLKSGTVNPVKVSSTPGTAGEIPVSGTIEYLHVTSSNEIKAPVSSSSWIWLTNQGSFKSFDEGIYQDVEFTVQNNLTPDARTGSFTFGLKDTTLETHSVDWVVQQAGDKKIEAETRYLTYSYHSGSQDLKVSYYNIPVPSITAPSSSQTWTSFEVVGQTTEGNRIDRVYRITVPENKGQNRGATVQFGCNIPGVVSEYISIAQNVRTWVEIDEDGQYKMIEVPARDPYPGEEPTYYSSSLFYFTEKSGSANIKEPIISAGADSWIWLEYSGSIKTHPEAWIDIWKVRIQDNQDPKWRTGTIYFNLEGGEPGQATWTIRQKPRVYITPYPAKIYSPKNRMDYGLDSSYPPKVVWEGVSMDDPIQSGSYGGDWAHWTEVSRSYEEVSGVQALTAYYDILIDRNKGEERQMGSVFTYDEEEARTVILQSADIKSILTGVSSSVTSSHIGQIFDFGVDYYYVSKSAVKAPEVIGASWATITERGTSYSDNVCTVNYRLTVPSYTGSKVRAGEINFGIVNENAETSLGVMQYGAPSIVVDPDYIILPSRESITVVGTSYINISSSRVNDPVVSSDRIGIESRTGFEVNDNYVELLTVRVPANETGQKFTGSIKYQADSYTGSLNIIQGAYPYITTNPEGLNVTASGITNSSLTASYFNFLQSEILSPVSSSGDVTLTFVDRKTSTGSLDEEVNVEEHYRLSVAPNTGSIMKNHSVTFRAADQKYDFNINQYARESIVVEPSASIYRSMASSQSVKIDYLGINTDSRIDDPIITGSFISTSLYDHGIIDGHLYEIWNVSVEENTSSVARTGKVVFGIDNGTMTGSFSVTQSLPSGVELNPSTQYVPKSGGSFSTVATYRGYIAGEAIPEPIHPIQVSVSESSRRQEGTSLLVTYSITVISNPDAQRTLRVSFPYEDETETYTITQEGEGGDSKVKVVSSNPLSAPQTQSIQSVLVRYSTDNQSNIQTPTFSSGITLQNTEVVSSTGGEFTLKYTISISRNNTGTRRTMTGQFSLLEGGVTHRDVLTVNQASSQDISLLYSTAPVWVENTLTISNTDSTTLNVSLENIGQVYSKTLFRAPNSNDINIDINRILESYLGASDLSTSGISRRALVATLSTPQDFTTVGIINDWSYELRDSYKILSNPINRTVALGQYFPMTLFCPDNSTSSIPVRKPGGSSTSYSVSGQYNIEDVMIPIDTCGTWTINGKTYETIDSKYVLYYYNKLGGWDSLPVAGVVIPEHEYERSTVGVKRLTTLDYNVLGNKKYELHTGILMDDQAKEVDNLVGSVKLYLQDTSNSTLIPVRVIDDSVQIKSYKNQGRSFPMYSFNVMEIETKKRK